MKDSYVIFICDFDIFDDNMYMYTCNTRCNETNKEVDGSVLRHRLSRETRIEFMSLRAELEDAYDEGERKGMELGEEIGEKNTAISNVKSLMKNLNYSLDEAIKLLNIKEDLIDAVKEAIK